MPLRHADRADYYLLQFDRDGNERPEADGSLLSERVSQAVRDGATDVFLASHGWMGDVPAAISQYDSWTDVMAGQTGDLSRAHALDQDFNAVVIGVHWPSRPWGTEGAGAALLSDDVADEFTDEQLMSSAGLIRRYAGRIADTDAARAALTTILDTAADEGTWPTDATLPPQLEAAYQALFRESGLDLGGPAASPGSDQQAFSPALTISEWTSATGDQEEPVRSGPGLLGEGPRRSARDVLLMPVRQLSFWSMKNRARRVGESGVHSLLARLQASAPGARFHLMGHSFGCIVVSAAVSGPLTLGAITSRLPRPVTSLFLVQGAMSLWSFAESIPYPPGSPGYFRAVNSNPALVGGSIVTTRSTFDRAVGTFFPLATRLGHDLLLGEELPEFGGVGVFGIQGTAPAITHDLRVLNASGEYGFEAGHIYNVDASRIICHGGGASGAHCDIAYPEIAHLYWQSALAAMASA